MSTSEWALGILLGFWLLLSALCQVTSRFTARIRIYDLFATIPHWVFFAPYPVTTDLSLSCRDCFEDGTWSPWYEVIVPVPCSLLRSVWNPNKRIPKALFDIYLALARALAAGKIPVESVKVSVPYLLLLGHVSSLPRKRPAVRTQFRIEESFGFISNRDKRLVLLSEVHDLDRGE
jgi:hypothetical protein